MTTLFTLTDAAVRHIKSILSQRDNAIGFRLSIKKTGCSGYSYVPDIIHEAINTDIHFVAQQDLHVYVDPIAEPFVKGLMVDYVTDQVGLKQKKLVFINPNEKNRCGCGESFTIE